MEYMFRAAGPMVFARVYSGTIHPRMALLNTTRGVKERVTRLLQVKLHQPWSPTSTFGC